ncbi:serrate RNA effector molecule homolog isoform X2 [Lutzomyia longipalpis]|uniref:serrate RNA effector molecule homolog isoform X2 n=1 Tax=Lutzomyia longipalpis TaxID=7200 RepID=UPI002483A9F3|nr:serrate RNA effector molecule homolog isoform X2 [Lutzomyia longipalpis]
MGDSDDEYDRKRRDKFRGERSSGDSYRSERDRRDDRRDDWIRSKPDYREFRNGGGRERMYSPPRDMPPMKRMRMAPHDPYGPYGGGWHHESAGMGWMPHGGGHPYGGSMGMARDSAPNPDMQTQPCMMTLKQFLATQDDAISDSDAIAKYNEYKLEFKRQQLNEFFVAHKDEEWFKLKYHPEDLMKRQEEHVGFLKKRIDVFMELMEKEMIADLSIDLSCTDKLLKLLDTVVIKLEGGTEADLQVLEVQTMPTPVKIIEEPPPKIPRVIKEEAGVTSAVAKEEEKKNDVVVKIKKEVQDDDDEDWDEQIKKAKEKEVAEEEDEEMLEKSKEMEDGKEDVEKEEDEKEKDEEEKEKEKEKEDVEEEEEEENGKEEEGKKKKEGSASGSDASSSSSSESDEDEDEDEEYARKLEKAKQAEEANKVEKTKEVEQLFLDAEKEEEKKEEEEKAQQEAQEAAAAAAKKKQEEEAAAAAANVPVIDLVREKSSVRELHKTSSIFLRNLTPTITKAEVEAMCRKYDGFLRVAIADPLAERRWFRRGWVTFKRDVNIKEICWNLNNIRLRDCELGAIVNRDLSRRVRPANGIALHRTVVRNDIKLCARIIHNLDEKHGLWRDEGAPIPETSGETFGLMSRNPVLQNITDYLIDEASAEEDELLGLTEEKKDVLESEQFDMDPTLLPVLDRLILYLRIVHSVDFYNHCEYPYEDEMPNRCGIIHARSPVPASKITQTDIQDYMKNFEGKLQAFLTPIVTIEGEELTKLGAKQADAEVEKFITANTQELAKDKWLCPLSGKKFKGPEFIRKHILNKHSEKIEEVKKEVEFFNNYLKDPKRPQLPEHPGTAKRAGGVDSAAAAGHPGMAGGGYRGGAPFGGGGPYGAPPYNPYGMMPPRGPRGGHGGGFPRRNTPTFRGGPDYRPIIHYRDLDAPREPDEFL